MRRHAFLGLGLSLLGVVSSACSEEVLIGMDRPDAGEFTGGSGGSGGTGGDAAGTGGTVIMGGSAGTLSAAGGSAGATAGSAGTPACEPAQCGTSVYECGDCRDNDLDGLIDADDPECLGPCDATEDSLMLGIPGNDTGSCQADCAFDRGASRNDGCLYTHQCDQLSMAPSYPPTGRVKCEYDENATIPGVTATCADFRADQPAECRDLCLPLVPNGCDCFGCCEIPGRSGRFVWVGGAGAEVAACIAGTLDNQAVCPPCTPVGSCFNPCDTCEYCTGGVTPDASCPGAAACDFDRPSCTGRTECPSGAYCITGCCVGEPR
jgi:hypothetical protein